MSATEAPICLNSKHCVEQLVARGHGAPYVGAQSLLSALGDDPRGFAWRDTAVEGRTKSESSSSSPLWCRFREES